jgi:AAA ATPase domain
LIGREGECEVLERLLEAGRRGQSGSLVVVGEPGIGKTMLLRHAADGASGFRMLRALGLEAEATLSFAGLLALFRPVLGLLDGLPRPQAAALAGALALAPPVPGDRFTVAAAALSLLAAAAEQQPVLVVADDAHWLDAASREALLFATRRLRDEAVVVLFAAREGEGEGVDWSGVDLLRLEGIDRRGSGMLLAQRTGRSVGEPVAERLCDATHGNPLAMLEIARAMSDEELAGRATVAELPAAAGVEEAFRRRVSALPRDCGRALVVAAAGEALSVGQILAACALLDLEHSSGDFGLVPQLVACGLDADAFRKMVRLAVPPPRSSARERPQLRAQRSIVLNDHWLVALA